MHIITKNEICEIEKDGKPTVSLKGDFESQDLSSALTKALTRIKNIVSLHLEDSSTSVISSVTKALPTSTIKILALGKLENETLKKIMASVKESQNLQALLFHSSLNFEKAKIIAETLENAKHITTIGMTHENIEVLLTNLTPTTAIEKISIDDLNEKSCKLLIQYLKKTTHVKVLRILKSIEEPHLKTLCELFENLTFASSNKKLDEIITKVQSEVKANTDLLRKKAEISSNSPEKNTTGSATKKIADQISSNKTALKTSAPPIQKSLETKPNRAESEIKMDLQKRYRELAHITLFNKELNQHNQYYQEKLIEYQHTIQTLEAFNPQKRKNEATTEESKKRRKVSLPYANEEDFIKMIPSICRNDNNEAFTMMVERLNKDNIEKILKQKFSNYNILYLVANYKSEYFIEFYTKCCSLYPDTPKFLSESLSPLSLNILHILAKNLQENTFCSFIELIPVDIFKKLALQKSEKINSVNIAPIHYLALYHSGSSMMKILEKIDAEKTTLETDRLFAQCLNDNTTMQEYHKNYLLDQFKLSGLTNEQSLKIPDEYVNHLNNLDSLQVLSEERQRLKEVNKSLKKQVKNMLVNVSEVVANLPLFTASIEFTTFSPEKTVNQQPIEARNQKELDRLFNHTVERMDEERMQQNSSSALNK